MSHAKWSIISDEPGLPLVIQDQGPWIHRKTITNDAEWVVAMLWDEKKLVPGRRLFYFDSERVLDELLVVGTGRFGGFKPLSNRERGPYLRLVPTRDIYAQAREYAERQRNNHGAPYHKPWQDRLYTSWMAGYVGDPHRHGANFEAPLYAAWKDGKETAHHESARAAVVKEETTP